IPREGNEVMHHVRRAFVLANLPGGQARALEAYQEARKAGQGGRRGGRGDFYPPMVLLLLGRKAEAAALYRKVAREGVDLPLDRFRREGYMPRYGAGLLTAEKLLEAAGHSRWCQCEAHFFIGLNLLAEGDRAGARRH